jgi:hypothetical protein
MPGELSTHDSIVLDMGIRWTQLPNYHPVKVLYDKFWNQGTQNWPENGSMDVDRDKNAEANEEDEIGPGTGILDIGIKDLEPSKLWIRKEYIRLYEHCHRYFKNCDNMHMVPSVVITGQPGIGEHFTLLSYGHLNILAQREELLDYVCPV